MLPGSGPITEEDLGGVTPSWFSVHASDFTVREGPFGFSKPVKLICVSNRLPSTATKTDASWHLKKSTGGLASALSACENLHMTHIGWPGAEIPDEHRSSITSQLKGHDCIPVYLSHEEVELYYGGFSNGVLWPIFHYVTPAVRVGSMKTEWEMYVHVNRVFAEAVAQQIQNTSETLIWIHDYHLMLVPQFIRALVPSARIGWFLHTPFPSYEIFRVLPQRLEILQGLLSANFLAFQTEDYANHFLETCSRLTNIPVDIPAQVIDASSLAGPCPVHVGVVPIGIDPYPFMDALSSDPRISEKVAQFRSELFGDRRVILGVDRLDYMKGIEQKLRGYEEFLNVYPEWAGNCVLVQLAVPSRGDVKEYQRLRRHVHELVGEISGSHSNLQNFGPPVIYLDQSVQFTELVALYCLADVMLITSIRDGMNLVAFEYIAANPEGVLVLSEFAGATRALRNSGALIVNPWDSRDVANSIHHALTMEPDERRIRYDYCLSHVCENTASNWAGNFLKLLDMYSNDVMPTIAPIPEILTHQTLVTIVAEFGPNDRFLVLIDLDSLGDISIDLPKVLVDLAAPHHNIAVILISKKPADNMERWIMRKFPADPSTMPNLIIAAERGSLVRVGEGDWVQLVNSLSTNSTWISVQEVVELYQALFPDSRVESTGVSTCWSFSDPNIVSSVTSALRDLVRVNPSCGLVVQSELESVQVSSTMFASTRIGLTTVIDHENPTLASDGTEFKLILVVSSMNREDLETLEKETANINFCFEGKSSLVCPKFVSVGLGHESGPTYSIESSSDLVTLLPALFVDRHIVRSHGA